MKEHLEKVIEKFGVEISERVSLSSQHNLFTFNDEDEKLDEERREILTP